MAHRVVIGDVHRREGERSRAGQFGGLHAVVEVLEAPHDAAGDGDHLPAAEGQCFREGGP